MSTHERNFKKRIGINLLYLLPNEVGGTEVYASGLLQGLANVAEDFEFIVFVNKEASNWPIPEQPNFKRVICPVNGSNRMIRYSFEQFILPLLILKHEVHLLHSLGYVGPIFCPCPQVLTIHDLNYVDLRHTMPFYRWLPLQVMSTATAWTSDSVITDSTFSKGRICEHLKLPNTKVEVIYLAPYRMDVPTTTSEWENLKRHFKVSQPYIVAFGGSTLHKNIPALVEAFLDICKHIPISLVILGHLPPDMAFSQDSRNINGGRIITTGYIQREHILPFLQNAEIFVMPSLYEGFGLPILEAQHSGVPVACAMAGSLPEVAGDGAAFFDPKSVKDIERVVLEVLKNPVLRRSLSSRGRANAQRYSWEKAARETKSIYLRTLGMH